MGAMVNNSKTLRPAVSTSSATASTKSMPLLICDRFGLGLITWAFFNIFTSAPISPYLSASFAPALSSSSFVHSDHILSIREVLLFTSWALKKGLLNSRFLGQGNHRLLDIEKAPFPERLQSH
jgi:hypothetical protein